MDVDTLIADYLGRLRAASWPLAPGRREELAGEVAEHIDAALGDAGTRDEAAIRNVLDRLGPPEAIAAAEAGGGPAAPVSPTLFAGIAAPSMAASGWGAIEILAILFLTAGSVALPFIGPVVGLVLTWGSSRWTTHEKQVASMIVVIFLVVPVVAVGLAGVRVGG